MYVIVTRVIDKFCPISQYLCSVLDTKNISLWLLLWIRLGAPTPKLCVVDCALISATCLAFNGMYFPDYLEKCFRILVEHSKETLPQCLIKRDRAYLLKNIAGLAKFINENWVKKDLYMHAIGYILQVSDLECFNHIVESFLVVCVSEYCKDRSVCKQSTELLLNTIKTFKYQTFYSINEDKNILLDSTDKEEEEYYFTFESLDSELPDNSSMRAYILKIYNKVVKMIVSDCDTSTLPNPYYLPKLSDYLITLLGQSLA